MKNIIIGLAGIILAVLTYTVGFNRGGVESERKEIDTRLRYLVQLYGTLQVQDYSRLSNNLSMLIYSSMEIRDDRWKSAPIPQDFQNVYSQGDSIRKAFRTNVVEFDLNSLKTNLGTSK